MTIHIDSMGVIIRFPVSQRRVAAQRIGRIFEPQEQLEATRAAATRFFAFAFAQTILIVGLLQIVAR